MKFDLSEHEVSTIHHALGMLSKSIARKQIPPGVSPAMKQLLTREYADTYTLQLKFTLAPKA